MGYKFQRYVPPEPPDAPASRYPKLTATDARLWTAVGKAVADSDLWNGDISEEPLLFAMVPLHYAFQFKIHTWMEAYSNTLARFLTDPDGYDAYINADSWIAGINPRFQQIQFLYFAARFIVLAKQFGKESFIPSGLPAAILDCANTTWNETPAWLWDHPDFDSMKDRWDWRIARTNISESQSYYPIITEEDLYLFAAVSDLRHYELLTDSIITPAFTSVIDDILLSCYRTYTERVEFIDGDRWLFQKGYWYDHPEYEYAGYLTKTNGVSLGSPLKYANIVDDIAHIHRTPLWMMCHRGAYEPGSVKWLYFDRLYRGFNDQFFEACYVQPTEDFQIAKVTNYISGYNGVYRWGTNWPNYGYGPYGVTGTLLNGWWTFLPDSEIKVMFRNLIQWYPYTDEMIRLFLDTNLEPYVLIRLADREIWDDGTLLFNIRLSAKMKPYDNP